MKRMLQVLAIVLVFSMASMAAAKSSTYTYWFDTYCDGVQITVTNFDQTGQVGPTGVPQILIGGYHDFVTACGLFYNGTVVGMVHNLAANVPPHFGTAGKVFDLADNSADATGFPSPNFTGTQLQFVLDPTANTWAIYGGFLGDPSEGTYLFNLGTMTAASAPAQKGAAGHTTFGRFKAASKTK